jgi:FixJ family two-component response regulator
VPHNASSKGEIFVVDDDAATRQSLSAVLEQEGYEVICFADGTALLSFARTRIPACIFLDVRTPGKSGLEILKKLRAEGYPAPIFATAGQADIPMVVAAIKNGASDFIEKPFRGGEIVVRVKAAIEILSQAKGGNNTAKICSLHLPGCEPLTRRERDVLAQLAEGITNKEAARRLGLSARTIEGHRANIMKKVGVRTGAELVHRVLSETRTQRPFLSAAVRSASIDPAEQIFGALTKRFET